MNIMKKQKPKKGNKILVIGSGIYGRPFLTHGEVVLAQPTTLPDEYPWNEIKLVVFTGGADVDPSMYKDKIHNTTHSNINRDKMEEEYYHQAIKSKVPMVGICRGSQFLTVMNGGMLIQNVTNHAITGTHSIVTKGGETVEVTSTHHQMMFPKKDYEVLAHAQGLSTEYAMGTTTAYPKTGTHKTDEPEVVWYDKSKVLAVQFHPEYMEKDSGGYKYFQKLLKEYVL